MEINEIRPFFVQAMSLMSQLIPIPTVGPPAES